jgi:L-seryl-tRNA(Ser) seleniumtransferase
MAAVNAVAGTYSTLEYSPESGGRGGRNAHVEWLICRMTGAEAALVVNNNAAAVLLALSSVAAGREVIVSSGELVEIGGSFRIPDILAFSGATMRSVGCTNATRIADYSGAITENTAALLKVHPSNYRVAGFVTTTSREELAALAGERGLVLIEDLGSGLLCPLSAAFAESEQTVRECLARGSHLVTFSGDKLLGGPQIGVIAGSKPLVDALRRHQLLRALRVDKMTLAAFEATLRLYLAGRQQEIPAIKMIEQDKNALLQKARRLCSLLRQIAGQIAQAAAQAGACSVTCTVIETDDAVGGGAFPTDKLAGFGVGIRSPAFAAETLAAALRTAPTPVIPAIRDGQVILHVRTLLPGDEKTIAAVFSQALNTIRIVN